MSKKTTVARKTKADGGTQTAAITLRGWWTFPLTTALCFATLCGGCQSSICRSSELPQAISASRTADSSAGYLAPGQGPEGLLLLPPPPTSESDAFKLDDSLSKKSFSLRNTKAWALAVSDANLEFPHAASTFSCALSAAVTETDTPRLYGMLRRIAEDAKKSTGSVKNRYLRKRPFLLNHEPICTPTPADLKHLESSGSYPSGHNAVGMAWALVLVEISPERADAILARGQAYGMSRLICNVHWFSDALQGRYLGAYTVARLHADPAFRADLEEAKLELSRARQSGKVPPAQNCKEEEEGILEQKALWDQI